MKNLSLSLAAGTLTLVAALLILPSCGSSNPEEDGYAAMRSGEYQKSLDLLSEALDDAEVGSTKAHELSVARCQSMAHLDAKAAKDLFLALPEKGLTLTRQDFENVATELMGVTAYVEAAHVVAGGIDAFSDSTRLPKFLTKLQALAASGENPEVRSALTGLGYSGD